MQSAQPLRGSEVSVAETEAAFREIQREFPFGPEYMSGKLGRTKAVTSLIADDYPPESELLSIGCGPCDFEAVLSKLGYSITAIDDLNDQWHMLGANRERIKRFADRTGIDFRMAAANSDENIPEGHFDVVLVLDVIEHVPTPREFLNAAVSYLKPGGKLILLTPNGVHLVNRLRVALGRSHQVSADYLYWNVGEFRSHIKEYTPSELQCVLEHHNLRNIDTTLINQGVDKTVAHSDNPLLPYVARVYKYVTDINPNFCDTQIVTAEKPHRWSPVQPSTSELQKYYEYLDDYNLDGLTNSEVLDTLRNRRA